MKFKFTLFCLLTLFTLRGTSQDLTGVWKGYFAQSNFGYYEDRYKFEVQIEQLNNNAIHGVTYSYKTTVFYGKASLSGLYTKNTNVLTITETKLVEVKIQGETDACLMTCYLEYAKMGDLETLTGTYTSKNVKDKSDCGSGKVYLEKTNASDFYKEDFLVKREAELNKKKAAANKKGATAKSASTKLLSGKTSGQNKTTATTAAPKKNTTPDDAIAKKTPAKPSIKPGAEGNLISPEKKVTTAPSTVVIPPAEKPAIVPKPILKLPKPDVIRKRDNELIKTFYTSAKEIKIDLYDNGEIDGDTITVYDNNKLIISKKMLTDKPITYILKIDENDPVHELTMVAENLGSIPPNTALMIINAGGKRYELFVSSNEQKNAVVIVEYKPDEDKK